MGKHAFSLKTIYLAALTAVFAVSFFAFVAFDLYSQQRQTEQAMLEEARTFAREMDAVWQFMDNSQSIINNSSSGGYEFKGLHCSVVGKSVGRLFSAGSDYHIRYTNFDPRSEQDIPDEFETKALEAFNADRSVTEYYGVAPFDGEDRFRYLQALEVDDSCLECHGEPVGELDQFGYEKEGMQVGDIGGAVSITEPMDIYADGMRTSVLQQVFMVLLVLVLACVGIYFAVSKLVLHPLDALGRAAKQIGAGDFSYQLEARTVGGPDELTEFADDFDKMARQLERLYTDLESEVRSQTDKLSALNDLLLYQKVELKKALDRLSEETAYKNEFFAIMSHELRTPLTSILAFARILRGVDSLDAKTRSAVEEIEANATLLLNMVNNILTISKAEAHKNELVVEPVDFVDLLGFIRKSLEPVAKNKGIALTAKTDADVPVSMADWEKLRRIVENLVDNAIKYTHVGGRVDVRATFDGACIVVSVADDGMGIDEADQEGIFERYRQAGQSPNRRYRGTGLGLAVVKELAELHGGSVSVASARKLGSTFTVRIPYVAVDTEEYDEEDPADR